MKWTINHLEDLNKVAAEFWIMSETKLFLLCTDRWE